MGGREVGETLSQQTQLCALTCLVMLLFPTVDSAGSLGLDQGHRRAMEARLGEKQIMVVGTTLLVLDGAPYYSPSFPRGGLAGTFAVDVTNYEGVTAFNITVEHRDEHDTTWTTAGSFSSISATGPASLDLTGLKQIIRFKYSFEGTHPDGVHFIMQAPSWRPYP